MPSRHNTPCHRHDNRAAANTTRYPEGGTSRALTGPEGTRGLTEGAGRAGGERSKERASQAEATPHTKSKDEQNNRGKDNSNNQRPTGTRDTTKTPHRKHTDQKTPDTKGQPEQAETNRPHDTGPSTPDPLRRRHACKYLIAMVSQHGPQLQAVYDAAKVHAQRSRGSATNETTQYRPKESELPVVAPELTSELLHCLSTLPDPWPLAKITINMDSASQWVSRMCRLFFADEYTRHTEGTPSASQTPNMESAFQAVQNALPKLENRS